MAEFLNAEYNGVFSEKAKANWSTASRRQAYRNKNYANSSAVDNSHPSVDEVDESVEASPETDWSSPPAYLESLEYKQALEELRAAINNRKEPGSDEALRVARRRLEQIRVESESESEEE